MKQPVFEQVSNVVVGSDCSACTCCQGSADGGTDG